MHFAYAPAFCLASREYYVWFRCEKNHGDDSPCKGYINDGKKKDVAITAISFVYSSAPQTEMHVKKSPFLLHYI